MRTNIVGTTTTAPLTGDYSFSRVPPGNYFVQESQPAGYGSTPTVSAPGVTDVRPITVTTANLTGINFADTLSSLAGLVYLDSNGNQARDGTTEPTRPGVTVTLTGIDATGAPVTRTAVTNASGTYVFEDLKAGTYTVTLTVTDNGGATHSKSSSVTVVAGGGTVLSNGVPVNGLSAAIGTSLDYTMVVPTGASNLVFTTSGDTGDVDMYVKLGSAPTDTVYDCRPYTSGNAETCTFAAPTAGTYHVRLKAYAAFSGLSLVGSYTVGNGGAQTYTNATDYTIADNATVNSPITVAGRTGSGSSTTPVAVSILHTYKGDLKVDLVAPDGTVYVLHNRSGGSADNIAQTFSVNLSSEALNGTWNLRVNDNSSGDTGRIDSWSITF